MIRIKIILLLLISNLGFSQLSNKHWIPPLHANEDLEPNLILDHYLYLSTPEPTPFFVTVKDGAGNPIGNGLYQISQGNPVRITIGSEQPSVMFLNNSNVGTVQTGKGIILEGQSDFYASFRVRAANHAEFLSSKGLTGAGTTFRLGSLPQRDFGGIRNFVSSFMATEDNTIVNLSDYDPKISFIVGNTTQNSTNQTYVLNRGESVVVSGNSNTGANLSGFVGALLTSNKPIVVNTGNLAGGLSPENQGQDFNLDQIVPLEQVGTEYIIVKGSENDQSEFPLVIAHENNTEIFVNGNTTPITTLNAGEYFLIPPSNYTGAAGNKNMYIRSSEKIFLYQIIAGSTSNATSGFYFIPPLSCFWQKSVDLIPSYNSIGDTNYSGNIIIATETGSTVTINNTVTTATPITVQGNANWVSYKITGITGNAKVESTGALAVGVYGFSGSAGFGGYFSGFGSIPKDSQTVVCTGSTVDLFDRIPGNPELGGTWSYGGIDRISNNGIIDPAVDPIGVYTYTFTKTCDGVSRTYPILIDVSIQVGPSAGTGSAKSFCTNDSSIDLTTLLGPGITTGGNWTFNNVARANGNLNPATDVSGNYKYTIPASGVCQEVSATIVVTVNASPTLETMTPLEECDDAVDGDTNGITLFTLTDKTNEVIGSQTGITVKYYLDQNDAITNNSNNITTVRAVSNTPVYTRLTNISNCFVINTFNLITNPLPVINAIVSLKQCDNDTDAKTDFNLTKANELISNDTSLLFTYHNSQNGAITNTDLVPNALNFNASNNDVVWSRIETTKDCFRIARVNLVVSTTQIPSSFNPAPLEECDDYVDVTNLANDGFDDFDIDATYTQSIKNVFPVGQQPFLTVTYYESYNNALLLQFPIPDPTNYRNSTANNQPIWARVDSSLNSDSGCQGIKELQLIVNPLPIINIEPKITLCVDAITGLGSEIIDATPTIIGNYTYTWTPTNLNIDALGNENAQFEITQGGTYNVLITNRVTGCQETNTFIIETSSAPETFIADVATPAFSTGLTIICNATGGFGEYEYSLNLTDWQTSNIFSDLSYGNYTVYVRDIKGCGIKLVENLFAITYPNFFTPNGDGYNDTWSITGLDASYAAQITIYDRYGKLLKQIDPNGNGWNGMYNGQLLPATDYWFKIEYTEDGNKKEFKSHFSLKR